MSRRYPELAALCTEPIHDSPDVTTVALETQDQDGISELNGDASDSVPSPISKSVPSMPFPLEPHPYTSSPSIRQMPSMQAPSPMPVSRFDRPELAIIDLTSQIRSTQNVNAQLVLHISMLETRITDWQSRASNVEALVKERECIIGVDSVPLPLYESEQKAALQLREKLESGIAHEAASKGNLMQIRGKLQSRARVLEANHARDSKSSTSPQDAERALCDAIARAKVYLQATSLKSTSVSSSLSQPRARGGPLLSHDQSNEVSVRPTLIKLNRSRRSPFAPIKPPLPKLLTRSNLASLLHQPPPDENPRSAGPGLSVPPSSATRSSVWKSPGNRRLSVPVADNSFVQDRPSVNRRLAAFYAPRPSPLSEMKRSEPPPSHSSRIHGPQTPVLPSSPQSRVQSTAGDDGKLPSWVDEMLDHITHPLHHHRLASADLSKSILAKRSSSMSSIDDLHLSLQLPSPSPTRDEWELVGDNETLGGSKVNLLSMVETPPPKSIRPTVSSGRLRKSTLPARPHQEESRPSSNNSSTGWLKNVANKMGIQGDLNSERVRGKKGSIMSRA